MNLTKSVIKTAVLVAACTIPLAHAQQAGSYPKKPVRVIAPNAPGGGSDILARLFAQKFSERYVQSSFIVENIAGGTGVIGLNTVIKADPDGHTMVLASSSVIGHAALVAKVPGIPTAFAPISQVASLPQAMAINASLPVKSLKELIAYSKSHPGMLNFGTSGTGSTGHLVGELLKSKTGLDMTPVPFKGIGPAVQETVSGRIHLVFSSTTAIAPFVKTGKLRAIAITSAKRSPNNPDLPSIAEQGVPGFNWAGWYGLLTTKGTPRDTILSLNQATAQVLALPDVAKVLTASGTDVETGTPEEMQAVLLNVLDETAKIVKALNIELE